MSHFPETSRLSGATPGAWTDIILPQPQLQELTDNHLSYSILIADVDQYSQSVSGSYHTFAQIETILQNIVNVSQHHPFGESWEKLSKQGSLVP